MILVQEVLVSEEVLERKFVCRISACKGACCWEGDWGAPLSETERNQLKDHLPVLESHLAQESLEVIREKGTSVYYEEPDMIGTPLVKGKDCAYLVRLENGIARCAIEKAYEDGIIPFRKPVSCHLYPIRVHEDPEVGLIALNYDNWEICQPACRHGSELNILVVEFLKEAIIRRFGSTFYAELLEVALAYQEQDKA